MSDISTLYKAGEKPQKVHSVDLEGWLDLGWSLQPSAQAESIAPTVMTTEVAPVVVEQPVADEQPKVEQPVVPTRRSKRSEA